MLADKPIELPQNVFGLFELHHLNLHFNDGFVFAGLTPIFIGPKDPSAYL